MRVPRSGQDQGRGRQQRLLHEGLRLMGERICRELQPLRPQVVSEGNGLQQVHSRRNAQAGEGHQLNSPQNVQRPHRVRVRHRIRGVGLTEEISHATVSFA